MARYQATIETERTREDVFAYLSDLSTTQEWDPGVVTAERLNGDAVGRGTEFRLVARFLARRTQLTYRIVAYDPPHAVTFRGENAAVVSRDRITFEATEAGTRIGYDAALELKGPLKILDPLLELAFDRVGDRALAGMRRTLARAQPPILRPITGRGLDGRVHALPAELSKPYNFLIVAFRREQQQLVDGWLPWLTALERERSDVAVYELPVPSARYTDIDAVVANLELAGTETIAVVVLGPSGRILACETGGFDQLKARWLTRTLDAAQPRGARASAA